MDFLENTISSRKEIYVYHLHGIFENTISSRKEIYVYHLKILYYFSSMTIYKIINGNNTKINKKKE